MPELDGEAPLEASVSGVDATGDQRVDGLLSGVLWSGTTVTYSFPDAAEDYDTDPETPGIQYGYDDEANTDFNSLNLAQMAATRAIFGMVEAVAGIRLTEVSGPGDADATIRFGESNAVSTAWAYLPSTSDLGGDVWFSESSAWYEAPQLGTYGFHTFAHEIGHALGLKHGHESEVYGALPTSQDSMEYSVMTYRSYVGASLNGYTNESGGYAQTLMINDVAALQEMYGANYDHLSGATTYRWDPETGELSIDDAAQGAAAANRVFMTLWDGGGKDMYDLSAYATDLSVDLRPGGESIFDASQLARLGSGEYAGANLYNARLHDDDPRSLIENARGGAGWDEIIGNAADNTLFGMGGRDTLIGLGGGDKLIGGGARDTLKGGGGDDVLRGGAHNDKLLGGGQHDKLFGAGGADVLRGGGGRDLLKGGPGDDKLFGGGQADTLLGLKGDDWLTGGAGPDVFRFFAGDGSDHIADFSVNEDRIDLASFDAEFSELTLSDETNGVRVAIDDIEIFLAGLEAADLSAGDFIF